MVTLRDLNGGSAVLILSWKRVFDDHLKVLLLNLLAQQVVLFELNLVFEEGDKG